MQDAQGKDLRLVVVTAMIDPGKTVHLWSSWRDTATLDWDGHVLVNGGEPDSASRELLRLTRGGGAFHTREVLGVVPAFSEALWRGLAMDTSFSNQTVVAFLHDDLEILEKGWDEKVLRIFRDPTVGMVGFGGALGVGAEGMYDEGRPFDPMTLARHTFMSNMEHAEAHGLRQQEVRQVAVLDGFSLIGRGGIMHTTLVRLAARKVVHHAYDVAFGCETRRAGMKTMLLPIRCHHHGGMSAVANTKYTGKFEDQAVWQHAHRQVWEEYRDVMPFWV